MPRYELVEGTSRKFWEIVLKGKSFEVHFGRIGAEGQRQTKSFTSTDDTRVAYAKLIAEKEKKGYALASRKRTTKASKANAPATGKGIAATCDAIEQFLDKLLAARIPGLEVKEEILAPQREGVLAATERKLGAPFPADVRRFLARGLRYPGGGLEAPFASMGFDFLGTDKIARHTALLRKVARDTIPDPNHPDAQHAALISRGVALTYCEPELVVAADGVYHFSYRNPLLRVASSWTEFMEHWLAAGCFSSHSFDALWSKVKALVPADILPSKNVWVRAYKKQFPRL